MEKYCTNCGKELHTGARFCAKCGAAVFNAPANPVPSAHPRPVLQPQKPIPPVATPIKKSAAAPKRNSGQGALCIVLSVLLVIQIAAVALYGWPGLMVGGGAGRPSVQKSDSITLQEGQTAVSTGSGVTVDFGPYNAMDGEKVTVKELSADSGSIKGGTRTAYDISAGERTEFDGLLTIILPYDESGTDAADEEGSVYAEHYNPETGEWELVDYTVNTADNTVTITTDHLSQYCTVTVKDAGSPYALLSKFTNRRLDDETALAILREYEATGKPGEVGNGLIEDFYKQLISVGGPLYIDDYNSGSWLSILARQAQYWGADEADLLYDVQSWMFDVAELAAEGGGYKQAASLLEKGGYLLLGISALSLGDTMIEAYKGDESAEAVAAEAYKLSYNVGVAWLDFKKVTTGMVQLSMLGVIAIDYSLNSFMTAADQTYKDALFNVVIAYNEEIHPWTEAEWYARIMGLYKTRGDNPEKFNTALRGIMENYSSRYFYDNPEEQLVATNAAGLHTYTTGILPETDAAREYCIEQYMVRLGEYLQPVLEDVLKRIQYDNCKAYCANATELRKALNAPLIFEIEEEIPDGEESKYAGCVVDICRPDALVDENWTAVLDKNGRAVIEATVLGYIQACIPTQLRVWHKGDNEFEKDPILTRDFAAIKRVTYIPLGGTGITAKWFEGSWCYGDNIAFTIEIVDDQNCKHISTLDGIAVVHETTYVFDPATATLTIAYSPGQVSLLETVYYGEVYEGVDYIEIKRTSGSTVYERAK